MALFDLRLKALALRRRGLSIKAIAMKLGVSKSTSSIWCQGIVLTTAQKENLTKRMIAGGHKGRMLGALANKNKKEERINHHLVEGKNSLASLTKREFLVAGLALYWAEGTKKRGNLAFTNSDPEMIIFVKKWLESEIGISAQDFRPRIFINAIHEERKEKVMNYWSKLTGIPKIQFAKLVLLERPPRKKYENYDNYFGVLSFEVRKGTDNKYKVLGLIEALKTAKLYTQE